MSPISVREKTMFDRDKQADTLPDARSPAVILERALAAAREFNRRLEPVHDTLRELTDPRTMVEIFAIPTALAGLVTVILAGVGG